MPQSVKLNKKFVGFSYFLETIFGLFVRSIFSFPPIQRKFIWTNSRVRDFLKSLFRRYRFREKDYLIGMMIFLDPEGNGNHLLEYDGQQRVITVHALISSIIALVTMLVKMFGLTLSRSERATLTALKKCLFDEGELRLTPKDSDIEHYRNVMTCLDRRYVWEETNPLYNYYIENARRTCESMLITKFQQRAESVPKLLDFGMWLMNNVKVSGLVTDDPELAAEQFIAVNLLGKTLEISDAIKATFFCSIPLEEQERVQDTWENIEYVLGTFMSDLKVKRRVKIFDKFLLLYADHAGFGRDMNTNSTMVYVYKANYDAFCVSKDVEPDYIQLIGDMHIAASNLHRLTTIDRASAILEKSLQFGVVTSLYLAYFSELVPKSFRERVLSLVEVVAGEIEKTDGNDASNLSKILRRFTKRVCGLTDESRFSVVFGETCRELAKFLNISPSQLQVTLSRYHSAAEAAAAK